jgi:exopolysaccharide biosynthesis protein
VSSGQRIGAHAAVILRALVRSLVVLALISGVASATPTMTSSSTPYAGIVHQEWSDASVPWNLHLVQIDLTSAEIEVLATAPDQAGITTTAFASTFSAQVAINGDSFAAANYVPMGLALGMSTAGMPTPWTNTADDNVTAVLHFQRIGETTSATIEPPEQITTFASLPAGVEGVVSGRPMLVRAGAAAATFDCTDEVAIPCDRAPRTAVALSADGNTMWLAVVDGWQAASQGMLDSELASFLVARGADSAIALDPGASSTMFLGSGVISAPSDGVEVPVANHLAIKYGSLPEGQLVGLTCIDDVFGCGSDDTRKLSGVTVTLDDGRVQTTGTDAFYDFTNVTQRLACVTAKKTGYLTKHQCAQVEGDTMTYNSIAMIAGTDPLDASVPPGEDGGIVDTGPDAGAGSNQGSNGETPTPGMAGGCCNTGDRPNGFVILLVAWFLTRRRGTTV